MSPLSISQKPSQRTKKKKVRLIVSRTLVCEELTLVFKCQHLAQTLDFVFEVKFYFWVWFKQVRRCIQQVSDPAFTDHRLRSILGVTRVNKVINVNPRQNDQYRWWNAAAVVVPSRDRATWLQALSLSPIKSSIMSTAVTHISCSLTLFLLKTTKK